MSGESMCGPLSMGMVIQKNLNEDEKMRVRLRSVNPNMFPCRIDVGRDDDDGDDDVDEECVPYETKRGCEGLTKFSGLVTVHTLGDRMGGKEYKGDVWRRDMEISMNREEICPVGLMDVIFGGVHAKYTMPIALPLDRDPIEKIRLSMCTEDRKVFLILDK